MLNLIPQVVIPRYFDPLDRIGITTDLGSIIDYRCLETRSDGHVLQRVEQPDFTETVTHAKINEYERSNRLSYSPRYFDVVKTSNRLEFQAESFADIPVEEQPLVGWRWQLVEGFLRGKFKRSDDAVNKALDVVFAAMLNAQAATMKAGEQLVVRKRPSVRTFRRWLSAYEKAGKFAVALRKDTRNCGHRHSRFDAKIHMLLQTYAVRYAARTRPTMHSLYDDMCVELSNINEKRLEVGENKLVAPHEKTLHRKIKTLNAYAVYLERHGEKAAAKKFSIVGNGLNITRVGERIEMDEWEVPLHLFDASLHLDALLTPKQKSELKRKKVWVSVAIDVASRCILGMRIALTTSASLAVDTLQMCVSDKSVYADAVGSLTPWTMTCGISQVATDSGTAYISNRFKAAVAGLGGSTFIPPVGLPWLRGTIERVFSTFHKKFISRFSGRSFESVAALGDYKAQDEASLTIKEFEALMVRYVVDIYHNTPHEGLKNETPLNAWNRLADKYGTIKPPDRDTKRKVFGERHKRNLGRHGVQVFGLNYHSLDLQKLFASKGDCEVQIVVDRTDIGCITVMVGNNSWLNVPCVQSGFDGIHEDDWTESLAMHRDENAKNAELAGEIVRKAMMDGMDIDKRAKDRAQIHTRKYDQKRARKMEELTTITWPESKEVNAPKQADDDLFADAFTPPAALPAATVTPALQKPKLKATFED